VPTAAGFSTYRVLPQLADLDSAQQVIATRYGQIGVTHFNFSDSYRLALTSPQATLASVGIPKREGANILTITANGKTIWENGSFGGGVTGITSAGGDDRYVKLTIAPGSWNLTATYDKSLPPKNLAEGAGVTGCSTLENGDWGQAKLTDGINTSLAGAKGYTSNMYSSADNHECVEIDLGRNVAFNQIALFPRTDVTASNGSAAGFPQDFTIQVKPEGGGYTTVKTLTNEMNSDLQPKTYEVGNQNARYILIDVTRLGMFASDDQNNYRFQLAEIEVYNYQTVVARNGVSPKPADVLQLSCRHQGELTLRVSAPGAYSVRIVNAMGRQFAEFHGVNGGVIHLPAKSMARGVYFVHVRAAGKLQVKRTVVF
jgi:hypothetical protein